MLQKNNINSSTYKESTKQTQYVPPLPGQFRVLQVPAGSSRPRIPGLVSCQAKRSPTQDLPAEDHELPRNSGPWGFSQPKGTGDNFKSS